MQFIRISVLVVAVALASFASASATDYVLMSGTWTSAQTAAVQAAGGTVVFAHGKSGVGMATSNAPDFLSRVIASGVFSRAAEDQMVQWQPRTTDISVEETAVINPADDTFYPIQWAHQAVESPAAWAAGCTGQGARAAGGDRAIGRQHPGRSRGGRPALYRRDLLALLRGFLTHPEPAMVHGRHLRHHPSSRAA